MATIRIATAAGPITVHYARPPRWKAPRCALVVLHGRDREAARYCAQWGRVATKRGVLVAAPHFDEDRFPGWRGYNLGGMLDRENAALPPRSWLFQTLADLAIEIRRAYDLSHVDLFGHSAGAQLLHRHVLFAPVLGYDRLIAANAGWYTVPNPKAPFPYGLCGAPAKAGLARAFSRRLTLLVGAGDAEESHHALRHDRHADAQGPTRLARSLYFYKNAKAIAAERDLPFKWRMKILPAIGHSNAGVVPGALELVLDHADVPDRRAVAL
ncbi:MAG: hypothetical protein AAFY56_17270 [Pseudomonadota bacterium]